MCINISRGISSQGTLIASNKKAGLYMPFFHVYRSGNETYIVIRGSIDVIDFISASTYAETKTPIGFVLLGIYRAALYVRDSIIDVLNQNPKNKIFLIGHSYGGAVATVLLPLLHEKGFEDIFAVAINPPPSMSSYPSQLKNRLLTVINANDIVSTLTIPNLLCKIGYLNPIIPHLKETLITDLVQKIINKLGSKDPSSKKVIEGMIQATPELVRNVIEYSKGAQKMVRYQQGVVIHLPSGLLFSSSLKSYMIDPKEINCLKAENSSVDDHLLLSLYNKIIDILH